MACRTASAYDCIRGHLWGRGVREQPLLCRMCHEPVSLKSDTVVDEDGKPVHENCYVKEIAGQDPASEVARILLTRRLE